MVLGGRATVWRWVLVGSVLGLAIAPALPLIVAAAQHESGRPVWTGAFAGSVYSSLLLGVSVAAVSLLIGFPTALLAALYRFPGRLPLILFQGLPLLLPSFLLSIGWDNLAAGKWGLGFLLPTGFGGCVLVLGLQAVPLPFFAGYAACRNLTASQVDAARVFGGERQVLKLAALSCAVAAVFAALLAGILSLSDPGAPLIFGCRSAAVEVRTSLAALYDYGLVGRQCLVLSGLVLLLTAPVLAFGLPSLASAILARQTRPAVAYPHPLLGPAAMLGLLGVITVAVGIPALGLCLPVLSNPMFGQAALKMGVTTVPTLVYTGGAGIIAVFLATIVALVTARRPSLSLVTLAVLITLLAMPPALAAFGAVRVATLSPRQLDWVTRSQLTVALILGLRFLPVATVAMMRAVGSCSPSWTDAALVHGVSRSRFLGRVILPVLTPTILIGLLLVMVLAAADITTTHLLKPPGSSSLPVAVFTVMANSPEGLVASLCLLYLFGVVLLMAASSQMCRWWSRRTS